MAEGKEKPKSILMNVKEENEKVCLELHIQKMKLTASSPITPWLIDGEKVETVIVVVMILMIMAAPFW